MYLSNAGVGGLILKIIAPMAVIFKTDLSEHYLEVGVIGQPEVVYLGRNSDHPYSYWVRCEFPLQLRKICKSVVK
jgi:hypothetical protein